MEKEKTQHEDGEGGREGIAPYRPAGARHPFFVEASPCPFRVEETGLPMLRDEAQEFFSDFFHLVVVSAFMTKNPEKVPLLSQKKRRDAGGTARQASGREGRSRIKSRMLSAFSRRLWSARLIWLRTVWTDSPVDSAICS